MSFYVYELIDPRTGQPFYVGKGKNNRHLDHERDAKAGRAGQKCKRISEIIAAGFKVEYRIVSRHDDEMDAYNAEADHIDAVGLTNLTNAIPGGLGGSAIRSGRWSAKSVRRLMPKLRRALRLMVRGDGRLYTVGDIDITHVVWSMYDRMAKSLGGEDALKAALLENGSNKT